MHDGLVDQAHKIFPGSVITRADTYEAARDRVMALLREENRHKPPVERWISAARVFYELHLTREEPHRAWAARVLDEDLTRMLGSLHKAGHGLQFQSAWPNQW